MEKRLLEVIREFTENHIYVPTTLHSSGFNGVKIEKLSNDDVVMGQEYTIYRVDEDGEPYKELLFTEIMEFYPRFTLGMHKAIEGRFVSWEDFRAAVDGYITIDIIDG